MNKITSILNTSLLVIALSAAAFAADITSTGSGNWNSTTPNAPWPGGTLPQSTDNVTIGSGNTVTVTDTRTCAALSFATTGTSAILNIDNGITFTVTGAITLGSPNTNNHINTLNIGDGNLSAGSITVTGGVGQRKALISISTGVVSVAGDITIAGDAGNTYLTFTGAGTLNVGGALSTGTNFTASSGTVKFTGNAQTVAPYTYNNLTLAGTGLKTTTGVTVNGILSMEGSATASATPTYGAGASLQYNGTAVQTTGLEFPATMNIPVVINNAVGVLLNEPKTINSTLTLQTGWLDNSPPNTITVGAGGSVVYGSGYFVTPLPVEMTSFTAIMQNTSALLKWSTATETNNMGFQIERRPEGSNEWVIVTFIYGAGTSNVPKSYSYEDKNLAPGIYFYRIKQIDNDGTYRYYTASMPKVDAGASNTFQLSRNYPNPFNPATEIQFSVPQDGYATLKVYNIVGQEVATLFSGFAKAGHYIPAKFDGSRLASGIYFARLQYNGKSLVQRMLMTK